MLLQIYTLCAVVGSTILVVQLIMSVIGLGGHEDAGDAGHFDGGDAGHFDGGDAGHFDGGDAGHFDGGDAGHFDAADAGHMDAADAAHHFDPADVHHGDHDVQDHGSSFFFRLLSFRSLLAAVAFFGLGGGAADTLGAPSFLSFTAALSAGVIAMMVVAALLHLFMSLREEGTVRMVNVMGQPASVYLTIPGQGSGRGKVTVAVQNRLMEYGAVTDGEELPTGSSVIITDIVNDETVRVKREEG